MGKIGLHCFVSGKVQGVFFRRETQRQAVARQLTGWVKNLPDGRVETIIYGEESAVKDLQEWLWVGPPAAKVTTVEIHHIPWETVNAFEVR